MDNENMEDENMEDAPPSYDNTVASSSSSSRRARAPIEKAPSSSPRTPSAGPSQHKPQPVQKGTWGSFLFGMGAQYRISQEVRKTVAGLIHDLVRHQPLSDTNASCVGILDSCREVCAANSISLSSLLQEPYIEGHCPVYWAIVNRPTDGSDPASLEIPPLVQALLAYSAPLAKSNIKDIRLACRHKGDQRLFQSLRMCPEMQALSEKDRLLLGVTVPPDTISVGIPARHDAPFSVEFEFAHFQKRMQVSQVAILDFVSHGRVWEISFFIASFSYSGVTNGQWAVRLRIRDRSPKATVTATYLLEQHASKDAVTDDSLEPYALHLEGHLDIDNWESNYMHAALPDAIQYPRSTFLTADGTLRGKLTVQIINK
ncbi:hypothetical protein C8J57DRAFT_295760 [Mycena rebaudengoi]|nr:hypothetical protein C8J57DRAFT_295760 [Mycena rebaudengoi]